MKEFKLDQQPKIRTGFVHPERYFENVETEILQKIAQQEIPVRNLFSAKTWSIAAAAIIVIALSIPIAHQMTTNSNEISEEQLEYYIARQSNISEDDIVDLLDEEKIQNMKIDLKLDAQEVEEILLTGNNVEEYLIN